MLNTLLPVLPPLLLFHKSFHQALDDLRPHVAQQFIELDIRDPRTFVSGDTSAVAAAGEAGDGASAAAPYAPSARHHRGGGAGDGPTGGAAVRQHEQPAARKPVSAAECAALLASMDPFAISESPMPNGAADRVLRELTGGRSTGQDLDGYGQPTASPEEVLPRWMREEARSKVSVTSSRAFVARTACVRSSGYAERACAEGVQISTKLARYLAASCASFRLCAQIRPLLFTGAGSI